MQNPRLLMKIGNDDEFDIAERVPGLTYLGDDATPATTNQLNQISSVDGAIYQYKTYNSYQVPAKFLLQFGSWQDYKLAKHQILQIFSTRKLIRIRTDTEEAIVRFVLPTVPEIAPAQDYAHWAIFTENFDNPSGYRYSIFRSDADYDTTKRGWQFGMNIPENYKLNYHFTTSSFRVYNASDIPIEPYAQKHDLKIIMKFSGNGLRLTNKTDGSSYSYNKSSNGTEKIVLDGIATTLNGSPASANTDYGNITLQPGWNEITATGASSVDITFSFPFIYI